MRVGDVVTHKLGGRYRIVSAAGADGVLDPPVEHGGGDVLVMSWEGAVVRQLSHMQVPGTITRLTANEGPDAAYIVEFVDWSSRSPEIASLLNKLHEVRWDRFTESHEGVEVFGWIDRDDGRSDFAVLEVRLPHVMAGVTTSSAKLSAEFARRLWGDWGVRNHVDCQRVEDRFGELVSNSVKLNENSDA